MKTVRLLMAAMVGNVFEKWLQDFVTFRNPSHTHSQLYATFCRMVVQGNRQKVQCVQFTQQHPSYSTGVVIVVLSTQSIHLRWTSNIQVNRGTELNMCSHKNVTKLLLVYITTSFLFNWCSNCCFKYIVSPSTLDQQHTSQQLIVYNMCSHKKVLAHTSCIFSVERTLSHSR